jgi:hypothetical protein
MVRDEGYSRGQLLNFDKWWRQISRKIEVSDVAGPIKIGPPTEEETPRYKPALWPPGKEDFEMNLAKYRDLAITLGAEDSRILEVKNIPQDRRALYVTCLYPSCRWLNTNIHCPMLRKFPFDEMQEFFSDYKYAIAFKVLPPTINKAPEVGPINLDTYYTLGGGPPPDKEVLMRNIIRLRILSEMERRIRAVAYYDGYIMAAPMGSGPCLVVKCASKGHCIALKQSICLFVDVQPNGQVAYVDYHGLGRKLGWGEMQAGGQCAFPEDLTNPEGYYNIGLILID